MWTLINVLNEFNIKELRNITKLSAFNNAYNDFNRYIFYKQKGLNIKRTILAKNQNFQYTAFRSYSNYKIHIPFLWPDFSLGHVGFKDPRFPLPGLIGLKESIDNAKKLKKGKKIDIKNDLDMIIRNETNLTPNDLNNNVSKPAITYKIMTAMENIYNIKLPFDHQVLTIFLAETYLNYYEKQYITKQFASNDNIYIQCKIYNCPELIKYDLNFLFPHLCFGQNFYNSPLTAIVLSLEETLVKSKKNENLKHKKISKIKKNKSLRDYHKMQITNLCRNLQTSGYWSEYIELHHKQMNLMVIEYHHKSYGKSTLAKSRIHFQAIIFTTAPIYGKVLKRIIKENFI
ncbi:uncharacterized protein LOC135931962 isoform X2 [Gordionus sp. m RMFG-2023]|uniref:uncharacterized protein LOC135931962 isoform X2 n=1 Tax=Gordionus sp. m RMFG-2023 TaxID=3053472 RepID=UPI0031FE0D66